MQEVRSALIELGIPPRDIQYEVFGPDLWHADYVRPAVRLVWRGKQRRPAFRMAWHR
jgi:nitric oxide dioxygenase